jgi:hypothetical protein
MCLRRVQRVFFNLTSSTTNETLQKLQAEISPRLAAHSDNILLDPKLFQRVQQLVDRREELELTKNSRDCSANNMTTLFGPALCWGRSQDADPSDQRGAFESDNDVSGEFAGDHARACRAGG